MTLLALALSPFAHATELTWEGYYRGRARIFDSLSLSDTNSNAEGTSNMLDHRFLLRPSFLISEHAAVRTEIDFFRLVNWGTEPATYSDAVTGETIPIANADGITTTGSGLQAFRAWGEGYTPIGRFSLGRMPMQWGAGILWNDGNAPDAEYGDTADRFQFSTRIGPVFALAAFDVQYEGLLNAPDDMQAITLALGYRSETAGVGLLNNYRYRPEKPYNWQAYTGDVWAYAELGPVRAELEGIGVFGGGNLETGANDVQVMAFGGMINGRYTLDKFSIEAEFGAASGDEDPTDSAIRTFQFDRDHNLSLMMFEEPMPTLAAAIANDANDGRNYEAVLTGDGISNAIYFRPAVHYGVLDDLDASLAWLVATEAQGAGEHESSEGGYGNEFDLTLKYTPYPHLAVTGTAGVFLPGPYYSKYKDEDFGGGFDRATFGGQLLGTVEF